MLVDLSPISMPAALGAVPAVMHDSASPPRRILHLGVVDESELAPEEQAQAIGSSGDSTHSSRSASPCEAHLDMDMDAMDDYDVERTGACGIAATCDKGDSLAGSICSPSRSANGLAVLSELE